jgi:1,4-dihydroxy-6-naphthoate synthase
MKIRLGISSCPNDTFAFHGLLHGKVDRRGLDFDIDLLDIQELNDRLEQGQLDLGKASFAAALNLADRYSILPVGAAIGHGVGPLLLASGPGRGDPVASDRVLCPGADTTATLLARCLFPQLRNVQHCHFAQIMPALQRGDSDYGVVIHEGRFTFEAAGLHLVHDLGSLWEQRTGAPVPLGGLLARRHLSHEVQHTAIEVIRASLRYGLQNRAETLPTLRQYAQELADEVLWAHVDLYVNEQTVHLGPSGEKALCALHQQARAAGLLEISEPPTILRG